MKNIIKYLFSVLLIVMVGCNEDEAVSLKRSVVLYAKDAANTRTSFTYDEAADKYKTLWVEGDAMQVILASDGANTYDYYTFTVQDIETGKFSCDNVNDNSAAYNAYGVYPASAVVSNVNHTATVQIGNAVQSQEGENPNHVAAFDPMWGNQESVALDDIYLQMHHTASVMQFSIQNQTGAEAKVKSVKIYAPRNVISGKRVLNLQDGTLSDVADNLNNDSYDIQLNISEMTIANDDVAKAWVAMLPFTVEDGDKFVFVVTVLDAEDNEKRYAFTKTFGGEVEFPSGKVMEMYAPIVLSVESLMVESKSVSVDLTKAASYPDGFPIEKTQYNEIKDCPFGGYPFKIFSTKPYTCSKNKNLLRFYFNEGDKPTTDDYALIYLPYYEGYKIKDVKVAINNSSYYEFRIAIANPENLAVSHDGSNNPRDTNFDATDFAKMNPILEHQCCIYVHFYGTEDITTSNCNCYISSISVNYILE